MTPVITDAPRTADGRRGKVFVCERCQREYVARADVESRYCSRGCHHAGSRGRGIPALERFIHQSDDQAKKIRANRLINKRIKLGHITRPDACEVCGKIGRVDACHVDYDQPDVVAFACRSCHMRSHCDTAVEELIKAKAVSRGGPPHPHRRCDPQKREVA